MKQRVDVRKCSRCNLKILCKDKALHLEEAHGIAAPVCGICGKKFAFQNRLWLHQRTAHMKERNINCKVCGKKFFDNHGLKRHMLVHGKIRAFCCKVCGKTFKRNGNLVVHVRIHTGERPHVCKICNVGFIESRGLKLHNAKHHP